MFAHHPAVFVWAGTVKPLLAALYPLAAMTICLRFPRHLAVFALSRSLLIVGTRIPIKSAIIPTTTSSSMSVKAPRAGLGVVLTAGSGRIHRNAEGSG